MSRPAPALVACLLLAILPCAGTAQDRTVELVLQAPRLLAGMEAALFVDGEGLKFRFPADGEVTLQRKRDPRGTLTLLLELRQRSAAGFAREWSARLTLRGSGRVVWKLEPTGASEAVEWPLLMARADDGPLEVLIGGRMAGRTPVRQAIAPGRPHEVLWRHRNGKTACITDVTLPADGERILSCNPATEAVRVVTDSIP